MDQQEENNQVKLCFLKKWNVIYMVKFYLNQKILVLGHIIQLFMAIITMIMLYLFVNINFSHGIYLLPLSIVYSGIQMLIIKKRITQPKYHCIFQLVCFIILISIFIGLYFYIYNPTFKQRFDKGIDCQIVKESKVILKDDSYQEKFQVLTVKFSHNNQTYYGCGCGSNKNQETIFQTKIEPFRYIKNDQMISLNFQTKLEDINIFQIKIPSWMCKPYQNYTGNLGDTFNSSSHVLINKCYYNFYGDQQKALKSQNQNDYCEKSNNFIQVIFDEKPYFPIDQFCILIALSLIPFFSFSFNWILVIIIHYLAPCLLVEVEKGFFNKCQSNNICIPQNKTNNSIKIVPTCKNNSKRKEQKNQNQSLVSGMKRSSQLSQFINQNIYNESNKNESFKNNFEQQSISKEYQNTSFSIENKLLNTHQETLKSLSDASFLNQISFFSDNQRKEINTENLQTQQIHNAKIQQKRNEIYFSLPTLQKKILPPIQVSISHHNVNQERIKYDVEENSKTRDQPIQSISSQQQTKQNNNSFVQFGFNNQQQQPITQSILQNNQRKGLKSSFLSKNKSKVQFQEQNQQLRNSSQWQ